MGNPKGAPQTIEGVLGHWGLFEVGGLPLKEVLTCPLTTIGKETEKGENKQPPHRGPESPATKAWLEA